MNNKSLTPEDIPFAVSSEATSGFGRHRVLRDANEQEVSIDLVSLLEYNVLGGDSKLQLPLISSLDGIDFCVFHSSCRYISKCQL